MKAVQYGIYGEIFDERLINNHRVTEKISNNIFASTGHLGSPSQAAFSMGYEAGRRDVLDSLRDVLDRARENGESKDVMFDLLDFIEEDFKK